MKQPLHSVWLYCRNHIVTDALAVLGIVCAYRFCISQIDQAIIRTQGISFVLYISFMGSMLLSLLLARGSYLVQRTRIIKQQIAQLLVWVLMGGYLLCFFWQQVEDYQWSLMDTIIMISSTTGFLCSIFLHVLERFH